jgi:hypothetical protein
MWKTKPVSHISTPPTATTDKGQKRRYTNIPLGTKDRSGHHFHPEQSGIDSANPDDQAEHECSQHVGQEQKGVEFARPFPHFVRLRLVPWTIEQAHSGPPKEQRPIPEKAKQRRGHCRGHHTRYVDAHQLHGLFLWSNSAENSIARIPDHYDWILSDCWYNQAISLRTFTQETASCTSFLLPAAAPAVQSLGLDGTNRAQRIGKGFELFWVRFLRL